MKILKSLAAAIVAVALPCAALAQSSPGWTYKYVPTPAQWNAAFASKQDALGFTPMNAAGGVFLGRVVTAPPGASTSGLNLTPGSTPASPSNGDVWITSAGLFARINGVTVGPLVDADSDSFAATAPLSVTFPSGVATYALAVDSTLTAGASLGLNLANANVWTQPQTFPNNSLTLAEFPIIAANTVIGSIAGGTPAALSKTQITTLINTATASLSGAVPAWPNNATTFFRGDGTYATLNFTAVAGQATLAQFPSGSLDTALGYWGSAVASATAIPNCTGALTYSTGTHAFSCNATAGTGNVVNSGTPTANQLAQWTNATTIQGVNVASLLTAGVGINISGTTNATIAQSLANASITVNGGSPTGSSVGGAGAMMGLGVSTCRITPVYSGRIKFTITGVVGNPGSNSSIVSLRYGTGAGPANGAGASGTALGSGTATNQTAAPFSVEGIATGLSVGVAHWFDVSLGAGAGTSAVSQLTCVAMEF